MALQFTYGPAIDYLFGLATDAVDGVVVDGKPAVPMDGGSFTKNEPGMFVVGLAAPINEPSQSVSGTDAAVILGGVSLQEVYDVPCCIDIRIGAATQKQVRDLALSIFNPFLNALMADRSLGGLLAGGGAQIVNVNAQPDLVGTPGEPGQRHLLSFAVRCTDLQLG